MGILTLEVQSVPSTPAANRASLFIHDVSRRPVVKDDAGKTYNIPGGIINANSADVVATAADTYLTGSALVVPVDHLLFPGTRFRWRFVMTKTAAGVAAPVWVVRVGTAGTVADAARLTFTSPNAQTAVVDTGMVDITAILRNVGVAGVMAGGLQLGHALATTGFSTLQHVVLAVTSAAFDTTVANLIIGVSVNPGAAGVWTHQVVSAEMDGI